MIGTGTSVIWVLVTSGIISFSDFFFFFFFCNISGILHFSDLGMDVLSLIIYFPFVPNWFIVSSFCFLALV